MRGTQTHMRGTQTHRRIAVLVGSALRGFREDNCFLLSAAMSYYLLLSLAPMLVIAVAVIDLVWIEETPPAAYLETVESLIGEEANVFLVRVMRRLRAEGGSGWAAVVSGAVLFFTATTSFVKLKDSLNVIWGASGRRGVSVLRFVVGRLDSFLMILLLAVLLLASLLFDSGLVALSGRLSGTGQGAPGWPLVLLSYAVSVFFDGVLFLFVYRVLPDVFVSWRKALAGGLVTSLLFQVSKLVIGLILSVARITTVYGSAGAFVLLLIWVYYAFLVFFLGAEFTRSLSRVELLS